MAENILNYFALIYLKQKKKWINEMPRQQKNN